MKIKSTIAPGRSGTIIATGTLAEVEAWKVQYLRNYHPCGYGTQEQGRSENADGSWSILLWRSHTCD